MKKMFNMTIVLLIMYLLAQIIYGLFVKGHTIVYDIKLEDKYYSVKEVFIHKHKTKNKTKYDTNNYYYEISYDDKILFSFKLVGDDYNGSRRFLQDIKIYQDQDLICIYPIFKKHQNQLDVICNKEDIQYNYLVLKGQNNNLDQFVTSLKDLGYYHYSWDKVNTNKITYDKVDIYNDNILNNQYIVLWHYKGFYLITNNGQKKFQLLNQDRYDNDLGILVKHYYVIPEHTGKNTFQKLIRTNLLTLDTHLIYLDYNVAYNSFIQGVVDDKIYIIDRNSQSQYEVDVSARKASLVGNVENRARYYRNGQWEERPMHEIIDKDLKFVNDVIIPTELKVYKAMKIDNIMGDTDGYYLLYIKEGNNVGVYRIDKHNINRRTLLFRIPSITNIKYIEDNIYFLSDDTIYMYDDYVGLRPLVKYNELKFNQNNMYDVYAD